MPDEVSSLGNLLSSAADLREALKGVGVDVSSDYEAASIAAEGALQSAKNCMTIVACVNVAEDFASSPKGRAMAESLLKSGMSIPDPLRKKLQAIATAA